jgi:hypothetical protein
MIYLLVSSATPVVRYSDDQTAGGELEYDQ